jgi:hypothetical protein
MARARVRVRVRVRVRERVRERERERVRGHPSARRPAAALPPHLHASRHRVHPLLVGRVKRVLVAHRALAVAQLVAPRPAARALRMLQVDAERSVVDR